MHTSESITNVAKALLDFREGAYAKDSVNPHFKNRYTSLDALLGAVSEPLRAVGLVLVQSPTTILSAVGDPVPGLSSRLIHAESGEWIEDVVPFVGMQSVQKNAAQAMVSFTTYARRTFIGAQLSLATEKDDDGNAADVAADVAAPKAKKAKPTRTMPDDAHTDLSACNDRPEVATVFERHARYAEADGWKDELSAACRKRVDELTEGY